MSTDSLMGRYQGSRISIDSLMVNIEGIVCTYYSLRLFMYQYSVVDVHHIYNMERLHNFGDQEPVGRNDYYYVFQRSHNGRPLSHASS